MLMSEKYLLLMTVDYGKTCLVGFFIPANVFVCLTDVDLLEMFYLYLGLVLDKGII